MGELVQGFRQVFTLFLNLKFLVFVLVLLAVDAIVGFLGSALLFGIAVFAFGLSMDFSLQTILLFSIAAAIVALAVLAVSILISGIGLNIAKSLLEGRKFSLGEGFRKARPRFFPAFKQQLIVGVAVIAFLLIIFSPILLAFLSSLQSVEMQETLGFILSNPETATAQSAAYELLSGLLFSNALYFALAIILAVLVFLALLPFFALLKQVVFFQEISAIKSIKISARLAFRNFFKNYAFIILVLVPVSIIAFLVGIFSDFIVLLDSSSLSLLALSTLILIILQVWVLAVSLLFNVKLYELNFLGRSAGLEGKLKKMQLKKARR
ncbi:MAG: hypothetical protein J4478_01090 [Candidatus Diapherotrites archaeon]|uniref:Glycerophosphoryl diester phosphodiesterase membrane domain-containing protein n=1 Tax=Candidatus Iainarchaeum sp. TaxID=3101447 RepID=A0A7J4JVL4_9ARCH|nr:hypothetical protein [Candidatus Diapherotrites archaeon]HIH21823.1 hypothetical protein [Candidatus Diapherotrites archaeon]HIH33305.1 hypothetical protein [Candidatus Diapherotrites archaeon]